MLPGAFGRLRRNRVFLAATLLLAAFGPVAAGITAGAQVKVVEAVDQNWRGVYDILVRPSGVKSELERTNNLVEPNFLALAGHQGLTMQDLEAIRAIPGVEVAAPASYVGYIGMNSLQPQIFLDEDSLPSDPAVFAAEVEVFTSDGIARQALATMDGHVLLPPHQFTGHGTLSGWHSFSGASGFDRPWAAYLRGGSSAGFRLASPVLAVDPVSEQELLGDSWSFLSRLERVGSGRERTAGGFRTDGIPPDLFMGLSQLRGMRTAGAVDTPVVPLLVSSRLYTPLVAELTVYQRGAGFSESEVASARSLDGLVDRRLDEERELLGVSQLNLAHEARPFVLLSIEIPWPGSLGPTPEMGTSYESHMSQDFWRGLPGSLVYERVEPRSDSAGVALRVSRQHDGYRVSTLEPIRQVGGPVIDWGQYPFAVVPLAEFDLERAEIPSDPVSWAPVGAWEAPVSVLVADASGAALDTPLEMTPTLDPTGLLLPPPLAVTDLEGAIVLRGEEMIDAVRVRVAGLTGFDDLSQARVEEVAGAILDLGFDVDVMAGSSPQLVELFVPDYYEDRSDLGWVQQGWSTLGAAFQVFEGLSGVNRMLLVMAVTTAGVIAAGMVVLGAATRAHQAGVLYAVGWPTRRRVWWLAGESVASAALILVVGFAVWAGLGLEPLALLAVLAIVLVVGLSGLVSSLLVARGTGLVGARTSLARRMAVAVPARRPFGYSLRRLLAFPGRSLAMVAALALGGAGGTSTVLLVLGAATEAGPTYLAALGVSRIRGYQIGMVALAALAGLGVFLLLLRLDRESRAKELDSLSAAGVSPVLLRRIFMYQNLIVAGLAILIITSLFITIGTP